MGEYAPGYFKVYNPDGTPDMERDTETLEERERIMQLDATGIVNMEGLGYKLERVEVEESKKGSEKEVFIPPTFVQKSQTRYDKDED